jgi:hypothetical protein
MRFDISDKVIEKVIERARQPREAAERAGGLGFAGKRNAHRELFPVQDPFLLQTELGTPIMASPKASKPKIIYFVHDLNHADIIRRIELLQKGGAEVVLVGFHRKAEVDTTIAKTVIPLGRTYDGAFVQRILSVFRAPLQFGRHAAVISTGDAVMGRNLEMLAVAAVARGLYNKSANLSYECLDIHRLMTAKSLLGSIVRSVERWLMKRCQSLVTSSPGFLTQYFLPVHGRLPHVILVENKVFPDLEDTAASIVEIPPPLPWRIGWFGVIRCKRSLAILAEITKTAPGLIDVIIAGRPAKAVFGDVDAAFTGIPGVRFIGGFADEAELARLNRSVHFVWAMDFFEAGANSDWLLPNRLYRSVNYGAIPIALSTVETGRWLASKSAGLLVDDPKVETIVAALKSLTPERLRELQAALARIPRSEIVTQDIECRAVVSAIIAPSLRPS